MTVDFGNLQWFVLVADSDTPAPMTQYAGRPVGVPPGFTLPTTPDTLIINGLEVYGYARMNQAAGWLEWVMTKKPDPNVTALAVVPGPQGWTDHAAWQVYANLGLNLLQRGVSGVELRQGLQQFYMAAVQNFVAEQAAAGNPILRATALPDATRQAALPPGDEVPDAGGAGPLTDPAADTGAS